MASRLQIDLKKLDALAFNRREYSEPEIRRYHEIRREKGEAAVAELEILYRWMFVPITLWPLNIQDVFRSALEQIAGGRPLDMEMRLLLEVLPVPPDEKVCEVIARNEPEVQRGHYEESVNTTAKFELAEKQLALDPALKWEWDRIKETWNVSRFRAPNGVIRRTLGTERNLRLPFRVNWKKRTERFQAVFDAFCLRWNLYGMQHDEPLLMKLSVNVTPHGTMIFIPAYWSFDAKRDVHWPAVMKLHRIRAAKRQGPALAEGLSERKKAADKLRALDTEALRRGLKGRAKHEFLCNGLGWVSETSPKRISRLR